MKAAAFALAQGIQRRAGIGRWPQRKSRPRNARDRLTEIDSQIAIFNLPSRPNGAARQGAVDEAAAKFAAEVSRPIAAASMRRPGFNEAAAKFAAEVVEPLDERRRLDMLQ
jgi:hypothetical protein